MIQIQSTRDELLGALKQMSSESQTSEQQQSMILISHLEKFRRVLSQDVSL